MTFTAYNLLRWSSCLEDEVLTFDQWYDREENKEPWECIVCEDRGCEFCPDAKEET